MRKQVDSRCQTTLEVKLSTGYFEFKRIPLKWTAVVAATLVQVLALLC